MRGRMSWVALLWNVSYNLVHINVIIIAGNLSSTVRGAKPIM